MQKKNKIWEEISEAVNAVGVTARSTQEVRDKWKNLQSHAKREFSSFKKEREREEEAIQLILLPLLHLA